MFMSLGLKKKTNKATGNGHKYCMPALNFFHSHMEMTKSSISKSALSILSQQVLVQAGTKAIGFYVKAKATENWNTGLRDSSASAELASMISPQSPPRPCKETVW